jgi:hypothetical protein
MLKGVNTFSRSEAMEDTLISLATGLISVLMVVMVFQICILL